MNAITMVCYNRTPMQLELSRRSAESALEQDIPVHLYLFDNGSTPPTWEWMRSIEGENVTIRRHEKNISPCQIANEYMEEFFDRLKYDYFLGIPNDVILPPNLYSEFLRWPRGIVTGSMTTDRDHPKIYESSAVNECTPMAVVLIRKWVHQALIAKDGFFFDPRYFLYASDCDFALRMSSCGIRGIQLDLQYWHYGSASHRLGVPDLVTKSAYQADQDRAKFVKKWGFPVDAYEYGAMATDINFRGEGK